jgi:hypothetical protein
MEVKDAVEIVEKTLTSVAILAGGVWAYYNFFKGRVYRTRLEPTASGRLVSDGESTYLIATVTLKNAGLSKVDLHQEGSGLRVFACATGPAVTDARDVEWERIGTFPIFADHRWIEPGEMISEDRMIAVPGKGHVAFLLELRIVAHKLSFKTNKAVTVACPEPDRQSLPNPGAAPKEDANA